MPAKAYLQTSRVVVGHLQAGSRPASEIPRSSADRWEIGMDEYYPALRPPATSDTASPALNPTYDPL